MGQVIHRHHISSSAVSSLGYDPASHTLEVEYTSGRIYQYFDVPEDEYDHLVHAASVGEHLNHKIKGHYRYARA
jgi:hypothetical protein